MRRGNSRRDGLDRRVRAVGRADLQRRPERLQSDFEDANFRVIEDNRGPGVKDKAHGHPSPSVIYNVTDCTSKLYNAEGKSVDSVAKAGTASAVPVIGSHQAENVGTANCKQIFVEKK
jgi:hypothetical protein